MIGLLAAALVWLGALALWRLAGRVPPLRLRRLERAERAVAVRLRDLGLDPVTLDELPTRSAPRLTSAPGTVYYVGQGRAAFRAAMNESALQQWNDQLVNVAYRRALELAEQMQNTHPQQRQRWYAAQMQSAPPPPPWGAGPYGSLE